jgi:hypothetical protein
MIKAMTKFDWVEIPQITSEYNKDVSQYVKHNVEGDKYKKGDVEFISLITDTITYTILNYGGRLKYIARVKFFLFDQEENLREDFLISMMEEGYSLFKGALIEELQNTIYSDLKILEFADWDVSEQVQSFLL